MKKVVQIVLGLLIVFLAWVVFKQVMTPLDFQKVRAEREAVIIEQLKDIRLAERAYKTKYNKYTGSFDELIDFILTDSLEMRRQIGSLDDSIAVARGLVRTEVFMIPVQDTVFVTKKLTEAQVRNLPNIPYSDGRQFKLAANNSFRTESEVVVPVFECAAPYTYFLSDLNEQELVNLIDESVNTLNKYPGLKVGAIDQATNDAGNWE